MSKYYFGENIPSELLPLLKEKFAKYEDLVPGWCECVSVFWNPERVDETQLISGETTGYYDYRRASINICSGFLGETDSDREDTIRHELAHVLLSPIENFVGKAVQNIKNKELKSFVSEQFSVVLESVVQDVASALQKIREKSDSGIVKPISKEHQIFKS